MMWINWDVVARTSRGDEAIPFCRTSTNEEMSLRGIRMDDEVISDFN
jgi:hypothetical protein